MDYRDAIQESEFNEAFRKDRYYTYYVNNKNVCYAIHRISGHTRSNTKKKEWYGFKDWQPLTNRKIKTESIVIK